MEDAHTCLLDFDNSATLFAVYDGHGGSEVTQYVSKKLPEVLKNSESYKKGEVKQSMVDCFLEVDQLIISDKGLAELKELAGVDKDLDEEEDLNLLEQEAVMPLQELLAKLREVKKAEGHEENDVEEEFGKDVGTNKENTASNEEKAAIETQGVSDSKNGNENEKLNQNGSEAEAGCSSSVENGDCRKSKVEEEKDLKKEKDLDTDEAIDTKDKKLDEKKKEVCQEDKNADETAAADEGNKTEEEEEECDDDDDEDEDDDDDEGEEEDEHPKRCQLHKLSKVLTVSMASSTGKTLSMPAAQPRMRLAK